MKKNIIGIDFGTSTSVVRVKEFNGSKEDLTLDCKPVVMSQDGQVTAPTLIRINGERHSYGHQAVNGKGILNSNFKLLLRGENESVRQHGIELTRDFYTYLFRQYESQKSFLFEDSTAEVITRVSYPPQWDDTQKAIVLQAAREAGFKNVDGMDEASASVNCILNAKYDTLKKSGLLKAGKPLTILVIDMGAGTTDLAFVKLTAEGEGKTEILGTWPPADSAHIYGGCNMDERFAAFIKEWLTDSGMDENMAVQLISSQAPQLKQWKEQTVSAVLEADQVVEDCSVLENLLMMFGANTGAMPPLDRKNFEKVFSKELKAFEDVIKGSPADLREQTELVILTGGNSAWYWINDLLCKNETGLKQIAADPWRILKMSLPNETVARGLIYLPKKFEKKQQDVPGTGNASIPSPKHQDSAAAGNGSRAQETVFVESNRDHGGSAWPQRITFPIPQRAYDRKCHCQNRISAGEGHTVGIAFDGRLVATGSNMYGQCDVSRFLNIVSVKASKSVWGNFTVVLRNDGKVFTTGGDKLASLKGVSAWENIVAIDAGTDYVVGLRQDGSVVANNSHAVSEWRHIIGIAAGGSNSALIAGLTEKGTVVTEKAQFDLSGWREIVDITAGNNCIAGLRKDGTVVAAGKIKGLEDVSRWRDIAAISAGDTHIVGLQKNGTVVAVGNNWNNCCRTEEWRDIVAVSAGYDHTVGLKKNGIVVAVGNKFQRRCDVAGWKLI